MNATPTTHTLETPSKVSADIQQHSAQHGQTVTWQEIMGRSVELMEQSSKDRKEASRLLWESAKRAIVEWMPNTSHDPDGDELYEKIRDILGKSRKGDASKIRIVAVHHVAGNIYMFDYDNLAQAYKAVKAFIDADLERLEREWEDQTAQKATEVLSQQSSAAISMHEAATKVLSDGVDNAAVALLSALDRANNGEHNAPAHQAFVRAIVAEVSARDKAHQAAQPEVETPAKPQTKKPKKGAVTIKTAKGAAPKVARPQTPKSDKPKTPVKLKRPATA